jgi:esterase/lipase superfamily enzyme
MRTTVFFATNRRLIGTGDKPADYAGEQGPAGQPGKLTTGMAVVGPADLARRETGALLSLGGVSPDDFSDRLAAALGRSGNLLVFLHGFANSFSDALRRAAFNRDWLAGSGLPGADCTVIAFSWPSAGVVVNGKAVLPGLLVAPVSLVLLAAGVVASPLADAYREDQRQAEASAADVVSFLDRLRPLAQKLRGRGGRVALLAHSMGNLVLQRALERWEKLAFPPAPVFDVAISASADCDWAEKDKSGPRWLGLLGKLSARVDVLHSEQDTILALSRKVNGMKRLGSSGPGDKDVPGRYDPPRFRFLDCAGFADDAPNPSIDQSHQFYRRLEPVRDLMARAVAGAP